VTRGAVFITLREGAGGLIGLVGIVALTRLIGPGSYGLYAAAATVLSYLCTLSQWGLELNLVRRPGDILAKVLDQAFTLAIVLGLAGLLAGLAVAPWIEAWTGMAGFALPAQVLSLAVPGVLVAQVPRAVLARRLEFKPLARMEIAGQVGFYLAALPLAAFGSGVWAPVVGWWTQSLVVWTWLFRASGYRPHLAWDYPLAREMLRDGLTFSAANWVWQARSLVNPLMVGRFVGVVGVGYVDLAIRFADNLGFAKVAASRVALAAMARVQEDKARLRSAARDGARLQVLAIGVLLVAFAWVAAWVVPVVFGDRWLPVLVVYPFVALESLCNSVFNMQVSILFILRRNTDVLVFHSAYLLSLVITASAFLRSHGLVGYGAGMLVALLSYGVPYALVSRRIGRLDMTLAGAWAAAFGCALFVPSFGLGMAVPLLAVMLWQKTWTVIMALVRPIVRRRVD
jgi:PST family polysaccharide transporter